METTAGPARHPKKEIGSATKNAKNRKNEKVSAPAAVDVTDTVAMLTPFITEVDLWPAATHNICIQAPREEKKRKSITVADETIARDGAGTSAEVDATPTTAPAADRSVFLKEAKTLPALRYLENAMCDMR